MQNMFDQTWKSITTRDRDYEGVPRLRVVMVQRNANPALWEQYVLARRNISARMSSRDRMHTLSLPLQSGFFETDQSVNECFLFHGSKPSAVENICSGGFNVSLSGTHAGSLYGPGIYCGENSSKGDEYTDAEESGIHQGLRAMLICRVVLGRMLYNDEVIPDKEQILQSCSGPRRRFESVLGDREKARGTYREFVTFDSAQVFPEYVVLYQRE